MGCYKNASVVQKVRIVARLGYHFLTLDGLANYFNTLLEQGEAKRTRLRGGTRYTNAGTQPGPQHSHLPSPGQGRPAAADGRPGEGRLTTALATLHYRGLRQLVQGLPRRGTAGPQQEGQGRPHMGSHQLPRPRVYLAHKSASHTEGTGKRLGAGGGGRRNLQTLGEEGSVYLFRDSLVARAFMAGANGPLKDGNRQGGTVPRVRDEKTDFLSRTPLEAWNFGLK